MLQKYRIVIACVLSLIIVFGWNFVSRKMGWVQDPEPVQQTAASAPSGVSPSEQATKITPLGETGFTPAPGRDLTVSTPLYKAVFYSGGGFVKDFVLNKYRANLTGDADVMLVNGSAARFAPLGIVLNGAPSWSKGVWQASGDDLALAEGQSGTLRFVGEMDGLRLIREISFNADTYELTEKFLLQNPGANAVPVRVSFTVGTPSLSDSDSKYNRTKVSYLTSGGKFKSEEDVDDLSAGLKVGDLRWGAVQSNYFLAAVIPQSPSEMIAKFQDNVYRVAMEAKDLRVEAGSELVFNTKYYMGPKVADYLQAAGDDLSASLDYGWLGVISKFFLKLLQFFYKFVGNYGIAIILLTALIKIILWPLSHKSYKSMEKMKKIQPLIKQLQEQYQGDKQKIQQETMRLYKAYNVNPMGGCLPMAIQIPIFIALYYALLGAIELRHAAFITYLPFTHKLWLADLSAMDPYFITPIIMGLTMLIQQRMTPAAGDPTQQKVMMIMPVVFTFMFAYFPSGLVLYWLVSNVISIAQQWFILRRVKG